jgi:hypothetical protein
MTEQIEQRAVLEYVLLRLLADHPDGLSTTDAYDLIDTNHDFPEAWYRAIPTTGGYDALARHGYADWRDVPQEKLVELVKTEPQWQNELRWARNELRKRKHLDTGAPRGTWRLTSAGMKAAGKITLAALPPAARPIATPRERPRVAAGGGSGTGGRPAGAEHREALLRKLDALVSSMPIADLDLLIDIARSVRARSLSDEPSIRRPSGA